MIMNNRNPVQLVICVRNDDYAASLERRKIYRQLPDPDAEALKMLRVVDESGEDYLFPADYFIPVELSPSQVEAIGLAS